jgi:hypothetical protein
VAQLRQLRAALPGAGDGRTNGDDVGEVAVGLGALDPELGHARSLLFCITSYFSA